MKVQSLSDIYTSLGVKKGTIYVVPLIKAVHSNTDYLYQLYKPLIENSEYDIKSVSILGHIKFVFSALFTKNIVLHYHWLEFQDLKSILGMPWKLLSMLLFKLFGGNLVWTIHNLEPHNQKWLSAHLKMYTWMSKIADAIHIHCESSMSTVVQKFNLDKKKIHLHPHPYFPTKKIPRTEALTFLNEQFNLQITDKKPILLLFGQISEYKRIEETLDIIQEEGFDIQVLIVGTIKKGQRKLGEILAQRANTNPKIKLVPYFIKDEDIPYFYSAADFCFFNYKKILTSGVVMLAESYKKLIIAPNIGCLTELKDIENVKLFSSDKEKRTLLKSTISSLNHE
jgi:glycosyltransferase involved in cell wall biosynthesis